MPTRSASRAARSRTPGFEAQHGIDPVGQQDVVENVQVLEQLELLEDQPDVADAEGPTRGLVEARQLDAARHHPPGPRQADAGNQVQEGRLARAARADHGDLRAALHRERADPQPEVSLAVAEFEILELDHRLKPCCFAAPGRRLDMLPDFWRRGREFSAAERARIRA